MPLKLIFVFLGIQILLPFRYVFYPGNMLWTEEGFRWSWNIMLIEKAGFCEFQVEDKKTNKKWNEVPSDYLTKQQIKMMSTQPDMILQFAHYLKDINYRKGFNDIKITCECYVTLNGRPSQLFIDPNFDLTSVKDDFSHKNWILNMK